MKKGKKKQNADIRKTWKRQAVVLLAVLLTCMFAMGVRAEEESAADESSSREQLQITVVEDIPAAEIEESAVPLAAPMHTEKESGMRHAIWMGMLLLAVIAYVVYFRMYDRRLFALKREAAQAQKKFMAVRRTGIPGEKNER